MNPNTGHIVVTRVPDKPAPVGYVDLSPEEIASLPRTARRKLERDGETRLRLDHPLVNAVRTRLKRT